VKNKVKMSSVYPIGIISLGIIICSLLIKCSPEVKPEEVKKIIPLVEFEKIKPISKNIEIISQGSIIPRTESQLYPEIRGEVVYVSPKLDEGSSFEKGDVLLRIDSRDYELDIKAAEASLDDAQTALSIALAESNFEKEQWELSNSGVASALRLKIPQLKKAESTVAAAEANLEKLKRNLEKTSIKAPYDGLVRKKNVDRGTVIGPGYLIANIYAIDYVEVKLPVPDQDLAFLDIPLDGSQISNNEQPQVILTGSLGGKQIVWEGNIVRMEAEIDPKSRMAILVARVSEPYKYNIPLRVGQFIEAEITGKIFDSLYVINRELIKNNQVLTINESDSSIVYKQVHVLRFVDDMAYVDSGLDGETLLCMTNLDVMYDGMKIRLAQ
tara:strand:- start:5034 stop:6182 length:1149 start_codon:yes stop_codon:yes gene_type:complete